MDTIRRSVLGEASETINRFSNTIAKQRESSLTHERLRAVSSEKDELRRELSKRSFEISRFSTELAIVSDIAAQTQR